jgi:hypothetical protein
MIDTHHSLIVHRIPDESKVGHEPIHEYIGHGLSMRGPLIPLGKGWAALRTPPGAPRWLDSWLPYARGYSCGRIFVVYVQSRAARRLAGSHPQGVERLGMGRRGLEHPNLPSTHTCIAANLFVRVFVGHGQGQAAKSTLCNLSACESESQGFELCLACDDSTGLVIRPLRFAN